MNRKSRIVIADRSELALNLYRLLLSPFNASLIVRRRFEEVRPFFFRRERVDLGVFNSNVFKKGFQEIYKNFVEVDPLRDVRKIFICKDTPSETHIRKELGRLNNSKVVTRPFHPDEMAGVIGEFLSE